MITDDQQPTDWLPQLLNMEQTSTLRFIKFIDSRSSKNYYWYDLSQHFFSRRKWFYRYGDFDNFLFENPHFFNLDVA